MVWNSLPISISMKNNLTKYVPFNNKRFFLAVFTATIVHAFGGLPDPLAAKDVQRNVFSSSLKMKNVEKTFCFFFWNRQQKMENIFSFLCALFLFLDTFEVQLAITKKNKKQRQYTVDSFLYNGDCKEITCCLI